MRHTTTDGKSYYVPICCPAKCGLTGGCPNCQVFSFIIPGNPGNIVAEDEIEDSGLINYHRKLREETVISKEDKDRFYKMTLRSNVL